MLHSHKFTLRFDFRCFRNTMDSGPVLSSESDKEYDESVTPDFLEALRNMPGLSQGLPGTVTKDESEQIHEVDMDQQLSNKSSIEAESNVNSKSEVLTPESDKEYGLDAAFKEILHNIDLDSFSESATKTDLKVKTSVNQNDTCIGTGHIHNTESQNQSTIQSTLKTKTSIDQEDTFIGTGHVYNTENQDQPTKEYKLKTKTSADQIDKCIGTGQRSSNNSKKQRKFSTEPNLKTKSSEKQNDTCIATEQIDNTQKRKFGKLQNAAVVTPHKVPKTGMPTNCNNGINAMKTPAHNNILECETLLSIRSFQHDYILKGENLYLNNKILSLEKSFFVTGRTLRDIPQHIKELNRKVSFEKRVYFDCYKNYEKFMQKINTLKMNKKSKNPYLREYSVLQREEAYVPGYVDLVQRNCSDLNRTLGEYYKHLKEWTDNYEH